MDVQMNVPHRIRRFQVAHESHLVPALVEAFT